MTQREAVIQQLKALKNKPLKDKVKHIFTYYKLPIIAIVLVVLMAGSFVSHLASAKRTVLHVYCLDAFVAQEREEPFLLELSQGVGIDQEKECIEITAKLNLQDELYEGEALAAQIMGGMIDVLALSEDASMQWLYQDVFADLSEMLTADQLRAYEDMLLYVDGAVLEKMDHLSQQENPLQFPDPTKPEEMEDPIPVVVRVLDGSEFSDIFFSNQQSIVIGIVANAPNPENAVFFVDYVVE